MEIYKKQRNLYTLNNICYYNISTTEMPMKEFGNQLDLAFKIVLEINMENGKQPHIEQDYLTQMKSS